MTDQPGPPTAPPPSAATPAGPPPATGAGPAVAGSAGPSAAPGTPPPGPETPHADWTDQVTDLIVDSVDKVRSRTTGPILEVAKGSVYAVVALILVLPVLIFAAAGAVRLLNWALPGDVWVAYAVLAALLLLLGAVLWSRRRPRTARGAP